MRENWSSRLTFLLATMGSAIGLGNLWRFPYVTGENGGGAFVLVYLFFVFAILTPLVMAELAMGRRGQASPVGSLQRLCTESNTHPAWKIIGYLSAIVPPVALCFYSVVAGWSLQYLFAALTGTFVGIEAQDAERYYNDMLASPLQMLSWYTLFIAANVWVVRRGILRGIEKVNNVMLPSLFIILLILAVYAFIAGDFRAAWHFLFNPDFSRLTWKAVLLALGQALFSISVGTGALLTYGSYLRKDVRLPGSTWVLTIGNTLSAMLAGLAIFPIVFASGLNPGGGPGLTFVTLPIALGQMPGGAFFSIAFFVLVFFAAFTTSVAMLEPFVSWLAERPGMRRESVTIWTGLAVWLIGISCLLSFNLWADLRPLSFVPLLADKNIFGILDFTVSNLFLPINALLIALFCGWIMRRAALREERGIRSDRAYRAWSLLVRWLAPLALGGVLIFGVLS
jgi:NSS family neurotransmitter:Na+ symporter